MRARDAEHSFLSGGGELGQLIRGFDWAGTPIGLPDSWPQNLRTALRIMLTSRQPIWIGWGPELTYFYNDPYKAIIGGKHPRALGRPTQEVWHEIWNDIGPMLDTAMRGDQGTYVEAQLLIMERNGYPEETYYTFSYSPVPNDDGSIGGIICANTDDTRRVIGERQLALLRNLAADATHARNWEEACGRSAKAFATNPRDLPFAMIYTAAADSIFRLSGSAGIEPGHAAAPETIGAEDNGLWPIGEVLRTQDVKIVSASQVPDAASFPRGPWPQPPEQYALLPIPQTGETSPAGVLVVGLNRFRVFDDDYRGFLGLVAGQIAAAIGNAQAYEEERRRAEALAEIDRAKTAFFSNVSHEFRTPLTLMLAPIEDALNDTAAALLPVHRNRLETAHRNSLRLLKLVNSLLDFSRIEAGRAEANFEAVDLASFTAELVSNFESATERAGLTLTIACPPLPQHVYVDIDMWEKIVLNLMSNAFKFTFDGSITVTLRLAESRSAVELSVRDTGVGIPSGELPLLFERFHRVEGQQSRSFEGSGIGLALVQELVKLHGGTIKVDSTRGQGTEFVVSVPLGTAHLPSDRIGKGRPRDSTSLRANAFIEEALRWLPDAERSDANASMERAEEALDETFAGNTFGARIVVADDNADMRRYLTRLLGSRWQVEAVPDGEAALAAIRARKPDLVLADVMMPRLDGFALLQRLRTDQSLTGIPIILLSARAGEEARVEGLHAGADDYLAKPFTARELIARVTSNLELARMRKAGAEALRGEAHRLELLNRVAILLAAETELEPLVQAVTDAATELTGAQYGAFFYNVLDRGGQSYLLHTLSGASRKDFEGFPQPRNTAVFGPTFRGEGVVRSGDITKDPRYGKNAPNKGLPPGHLPVVSYLAVPVVAPSGEVLGGLFFAHGEPDRFTEHHELMVTGIASQAAVAFEKVRLYDGARAAEAELRRLNETLEQRIDERTREIREVFGKLHESEHLFRQLVESVADYAIFLLSTDGIVTSWNAGAERIKGYTAAEIIGQHFSNFYTVEDRDSGLPGLALTTARRTGRFEMEGWRIRKGGERFWASIIINAVRDEHGQLIGFAKVTRDLTERRAMEDQLRQMQKMEAIGQLTGGIAHDFNNMLQVIGGNIETLQRRIGHEDANAHRLIAAALRGTDRASTLTHRLLAFSRRQPLEPKPIELNRLIIGMSDLVTRTLGERIKVESVLSGGLWPVLADPNQVENAVLNLAVNARDAMPEGGKLTIETANAHLDQAYAHGHAEVTPGQYVMLAVSDTGFGMNSDVIEKVFEPFFTTKKLGEGTGLGLSQVYGFVKQSGGHIKIYSEPDEGTTVRIYFPRAPLPAGTHEALTSHSQIPELGGRETILVVEDDPEVRAYTTGILRELGYRVLEAPEGDTALGLLTSEPDINLLFTDIGLPGPFNGRQLSDEARKIRSDIKILFTTGYAQDAIIHHGRLDPDVQLIVKPFSFASLAAKIRQILDGKADDRGE